MYFEIVRWFATHVKKCAKFALFSLQKLLNSLMCKIYYLPPFYLML